jgi:hypothetical protein
MNASRSMVSLDIPELSNAIHSSLWA